MAYSGYLVKVGSYKIPFKFIKAESYTAYRSVQDLDSYSDANGELHRNALSHVPCKCEFETPALITNKQFSELMKNIKDNFTIPLERKSTVTLYIPESDEYVTQSMYMPDITPQIYYADSDGIKYNPIRLAFIGY